MLVRRLRKPYRLYRSERMRQTLLLALLFPLAAAPASAQWYAGPAMPAPRHGAAVAALNGQIYVIGGRDQSGYPIDNAIRFDPATQQWSPAGTLDHGRASGAAFVLNGTMLVSGGRREDGNIMDDVEEYDPINNTWFEDSECSNEREGHAAFAIGNHAYAFGGASEGGSYLGDAEWYQAGFLVWQAYPTWALSIPRASFAASTVGDGVLIVGGFSTFGPLADVEYYVPGVGGMARTQLPEPRGALGAATLLTPEGQRVYVVGGRNASPATVASVDIFDPVANAWSPGPALPAPREGAAVVELNGRLYVIGGRDASGPQSSMYVLDVSTAVDDGPSGASTLQLGAPIPNPTSGESRITMRAAESGEAAVEAFDALGRRVAVLYSGPIVAGDHALSWTGRDDAGRLLPAGVYAVRARLGAHIAVRRLTVTR